MGVEYQEWLNQGVAYMAAEKYSDAVTLFRRVLDAEPENFAACIQLGSAYACQEKYEEALAAFKTGLLQHKENGRILYSIGGVYMLMGDIAQGVRYYNRAQRAGYKSVEMYLTLAGAFLDSGDRVQAIRAISCAIELQPLRAELYIRKSAIQMQLKLYDDALETLEEYRELNPDAYETYSQSVQIYCSRKEYEKAASIAQKGAERFPEDPGMLILVLQVMVESGRYEEAVLYADKVMEKAESGNVYFRAVMYKATACAVLGRTEEVVDILETYCKTEPEVNALYMLMNTYLLKQDFQGVQRIATRLESMETEIPIRAAAIFYKANAVERLQGIQKAEKLYREILPKLRRLSVKAPQNYEIYIYRLLAHTACREYDKAMELAEYLEKVYPELPDGPLYKSHIYARQGQKQKAADARAEALRIAPGLKIPDIR